LIVDDDRDIVGLVTAVLSEDGFTVSSLVDHSDGPLLEAVGRLEPDCVLLDSSSHADYGVSWELAATLASRSRPVPVIMFTGHRSAISEALEGVSDRSRAAAFSDIIQKPFDLDELVNKVAQAVGKSVSIDTFSESDGARTQSLVQELRTGGATDIQTSGRREWATFRVQSGNLVQLYWWQQLGVYLVGRYAGERGVMEPLGEFAERNAALSAALAS